MRKHENNIYFGIQGVVSTPVLFQNTLLILVYAIWNDVVPAHYLLKAICLQMGSFVDTLRSHLAHFLRFGIGLLILQYNVLN